MFRMMKTGICLVFAGCAAIVGCGPSAVTSDDGMLRAGDTRMIVLPGGVRMEMVWCPATTSAEWREISGGKDYFLMGSPEVEMDRAKDEKLHKVILTRGFWIGKYEVTQRQWECIIGSNPSGLKGAEYPVDAVSWNDCQEFIKQVNASGRVTVTLPTEAQWEYACRAGTVTPFSFGLTVNDDELNSRGKSPYVRGQHPYMVWSTEPVKKQTVVGSYRPNPWGIYDMHGNVWEWCLDRYKPDYGDSSEENPICTDTSCDLRVLRGGSCYEWTLNCRSASRRGEFWEGYGYGLRLVCSSTTCQ